MNSDLTEEEDVDNDNVDKIKNHKKLNGAKGAGTSN